MSTNIKGLSVTTRMDRRIGSVLILLKGRFDGTTAPDFTATATNTLDPLAAVTRSVTIDMSALEYMSSAGLQSLLILHRHATSFGSSFNVTNAKGTVSEVLNTSGFSQFLKTDTPTVYLLDMLTSASGSEVSSLDSHLEGSIASVAQTGPDRWLTLSVDASDSPVDPAATAATALDSLLSELACASPSDLLSAFERASRSLSEKMPTGSAAASAVLSESNAATAVIAGDCGYCAVCFDDSVESGTGAIGPPPSRLGTGFDPASVSPRELKSDIVLCIAANFGFMRTWPQFPVMPDVAASPSDIVSSGLTAAMGQPTLIPAATAAAVRSAQMTSPA